LVWPEAKKGGQATKKCKAAVEAEMTKFLLYGFKDNSNGRICDSCLEQNKNSCGQDLEEGESLRFRRARNILASGEYLGDYDNELPTEKFAVFAVRLIEENGTQIESCRIGFLPQVLIKRMPDIDGRIGVVTNVRDKSSNPFIRQQAYSKFGIAEINLIN
ncbi:hypothetical protein ROZALSC1DRAFT_25054, partial [Rozella allomycis CSF55]